MKPGTSRDRSGHAGERGFALVVAILALMLLTFLGLTLAATTSTELQIAANHRWSQQAYYNAEAGLELGKRVLMTASWPSLLWTARTTPEPAPSPLLPPNLSGLPLRNDKFGNPPRTLENDDCDTAASTGYGVVLDDGTALGPYQNVIAYPDAAGAAVWPLNGSFTLWVRWRLDEENDGRFIEDGENIVLTSEGTAPYTGDPGASTGASRFVRSRRAVRVLEMTLSRRATARCAKDEAQAGGDSAGSGFRACDPAPEDLLDGIQDAQAPPGGTLGTGVEGTYAGQR